MSDSDGVGDLEALLREETRGEYVIERELGRGSGVLYDATEIGSRRRVAIKAVSHRSAHHRLRGVRLAARFNHHNIVPLYRIDASARLSWYAMPYVDGEPLAAKLEREARLSLGATIAILRQVGDALDYVHRCGIRWVPAPFERSRCDRRRVWVMKGDLPRCD